MMNKVRVVVPTCEATVNLVLIVAVSLAEAPS